MSLMSYCTDASDCSLIQSPNTDSSKQSNPMVAKDVTDEDINTSNKKLKSNCSNIRKYSLNTKFF